MVFRHDGSCKCFLASLDNFSQRHDYAGGAAEKVMIPNVYPFIYSVSLLFILHGIARAVVG